jgi:hypothetical protein
MLCVTPEVFAHFLPFGKSPAARSSDADRQIAVAARATPR